MAKEVTRIAKLQFTAGQAKPGPELAGLGIQMPEFTKQFNDATKERGQESVPVAITVYKDRSFNFRLFTAPTSFKLLQAAKIKKGSGNAKTDKVGSVTKQQVEEIAKYKLPDLNATSVAAAVKIVEGTARNMGITIGETSGGDPRKETAEKKALKAPGGENNA